MPKTLAARRIASSPRVVPRRRRRVPGWLYPLATTGGVLLAWQLLVPLSGLASFVLPLPSDIARTLIEESGRLAPSFIVTAMESVGGLLVSIAVAVPLALAIAYMPIFERSIYPILVATQAIPKIAIAPLFTIWFGFGFESKLLIAFLVAFFPILIDTVVGLKSVNREYVYLVRSMGGASEWQVLRRIRAPYALPYFFSGVKVAVTLAVIGAVVGEFMGSDVGLGYVLLDALGFVDTKLLFAAITLLAMLGIVMFYAVVAIERLAIPWHASQRRSGSRA